MEGGRKKQHVRDVEALQKLAERIIALRKAADLTQRQLAYEAGLTPSQIALIETAKGNPTVSVLSAIAKTFELPLFELFRFDE